MARKVTLHPSGQASIYHSSVRSHSQQVFEEFADRYAIYYAWGNGATGDHAAGKAIDLMAYGRGGFDVNDVGAIRDGWNRTVARYAWDHRDRLGVAYIIYDQLIISTNPNSSVDAYNEWVHYGGQSHANHVHISFVDNPPRYRRPKNERDWFAMASKRDLRRVVRKEIKQHAGPAVWYHDLPRPWPSKSKDWINAATLLRYSFGWSKQARNDLSRDVTLEDGRTRGLPWLTEWGYEHAAGAKSQADANAERLDAIEGAIRALAAGLGEDTANAVNAALAVDQDEKES